MPPLCSPGVSGCRDAWQQGPRLRLVTNLFAQQFEALRALSLDRHLRICMRQHVATRYARVGTLVSSFPQRTFYHGVSDAADLRSRGVGTKPGFRRASTGEFTGISSGPSAGGAGSSALSVLAYFAIFLCSILGFLAVVWLVVEHAGSRAIPSRQMAILSFILGRRRLFVITIISAWIASVFWLASSDCNAATAIAAKLASIF
jgi:hypothetical protein